MIFLAVNARDAMRTGGRLEVRARRARRDELGSVAGGDYVAITVAVDGTWLVGGVSARVGPRANVPREEVVFVELV